MIKFDVRAMGLSLGLLWGGGCFFLGILAMSINLGNEAVSVLGSIYLGFEPTWIGSVIGAFWGFLDGAIGGIIFAWLYNKLLKEK